MAYLHIGGQKIAKNKKKFVNKVFLLHILTELHL